MTVFPYEYFRALSDVKASIDWMATQPDENGWYKDGIAKEKAIYRELMQRGTRLSA